LYHYLKPRRIWFLILFLPVWLIGWTIGELGSDYWSQRLTANADAKYLFSRLLILI
jgi:hypothetical protein